MKQTYSMVEWDSVKEFEDLKVVIKAVHGTLGFSKENMFYDELKKRSLLGEEQTVDVPDQPVDVPIPPAPAVAKEE